MKSVLVSVVTLAMIGFASGADEQVCPKLQEEMVPMRDGVRLFTRAMIPGDGKFPCVFSRTPYPRGNTLKSPYPRELVEKDVCVRHGYVSVGQHCRGFGLSEGLCRPYVEREDGLDTLEWIRRQPWYNGEIFLDGGSYLSTVHLSYLSADPPDVKGAWLSIQTDRMYFRNFRNGCCYNWSNFNWWRSMMSREFPSAATASAAIRRPYKDIARRAFGRDVPAYTDRLMHVDYDSFWQDQPQVDAVPHVRFPVVWTDGWWDFYIEGMTSMWERMPPEWKSRSAFVIAGRGHAETGALTHSTIPHARQTEPQADEFDFFDAIRRGDGKLTDYDGKVRAYSVGDDTWFTTEWPRAKEEMCPLRLSADGTLVDGSNLCAGAVSWVYDPSKSYGGFGDSFSVKAFDAGNCGYARAFVSRPFERARAFFGRPRVRIPVRSTCEDTQFLFRIDLITPSNEAWSVCQTITSLRHVKPDYRPGEIAVADLELPLTAFAVGKGWGVRLDVTSQGGPWVPHANVAKHWAEVLEEEVRVATNSVVCGNAVLSLPLR